VFINEVFLNPPGSSDDGREYIELLGTPGRKLDGYAIVVLNGTDEKLYPLGSIPPVPFPTPEIDEFFSLDGLTLGDNGILVLVIRNPSTFYYPELLSDSNFVNWTGLWNGGLDIPGQLSNNGSVTVMLLRNRPGQTEADPGNPNGLRWGKEIHHDAELFTPVWDPADGNTKDQWGDGNLDRGDTNGLGGYNLEMTGLNTGGDLTDDLEVVDEVSFEDLHGWEYDADGRHVDAGSTFPGLPHRHVHALDDPAGFNPDTLSRVDYRTKGNGWTPADNGTGEMANGNNWQDTATEQWIRGQSISGSVPAEGRLGFFYINTANPEPGAVQPYQTHVPLWLDDGNSPDYNFGSANTYEIAAGRINLLAVPFIPGDCDRDGVCDANDIAKIAAVFGDNDWIFSNSFFDAPEGDSGDPATQIRPWDVEATGDNGIEASDLQWTLNFQGDSTGQIAGVQYDSITPAVSGVVLNPNTGVECTVTTSVNIPGGRTLTTLLVDDIVEVTVSAEVTAGPNTTSGHENGIMQYIHDVVIDSAGIIKVTLVEPLGSFNTTRAPLQTLQGTDGDLGIELINAYTTSFTEGLTGSADLYRITLQAVGEGSADVSISPAAAAGFAAGTIHGLKIGHTKSNGDPNSAIYPASTSVAVVPKEDLDGNGVIGWGDLEILSENWLVADQLLSSCVGHWKMNDNANNNIVANKVGYNGTYHGTGGADDYTSAHHQDSGNPPNLNGALEFDGVQDYVDVGNVIGTGAYTKAAWFKRVEGVNIFNNIVSSSSSSSNAAHAIFAPYYWSFKLSAGHIGPYNAVQDSNGLEADRWYHVVLTYDPNVDSGKMVLYKDGVEVDSATDVPANSVVVSTYIGSFSGIAHFKGSIDNVIVFDRALIPEEVGILYNNGNGMENPQNGDVIDGDINDDGIVHFLDFARLAQAW
jgi:hypothetical protein